MYVLMSMLLYSSWVKGDDWAFINMSEDVSLYSRYRTALHRYLTWVSRGGEFYGTLIGLSFNRWQNWFFVPLVSVFAPFAFFAMVKRPGDTIYSRTGVLFYISIFFLCLLGVNLPVWRNYWCYAAAVNYLFPTVLTVWFLSYYRTDRGAIYSKKTQCLALFVLGLLSGWGTECMTVTVLPLLSVWVFYNLLRKNRLPLSSYWGYVGFLAGAFLLFASPALSMRNKQVTESLQGFVSSMNSDHLEHFLHNLNAETIELLRGVSGIISLKDIPIFSHIYFIPYASQLFMSCCWVAMLVFTILIVIRFVSKKESKKDLLVAMSFLLISWLCSFSYLAQCIPNTMSYLPPSFILIAGCGYLFIRTKFALFNAFLTAALLIFAGITFVPPGIEAWNYKKYEKMRHEQILSLKAQGVDHIVLERPYPTEPKDEISLIKRADLKDNPDKYPNQDVAHYYKVSTIRQKEAVK